MTGGPLPGRRRRTDLSFVALLLLGGLLLVVAAVPALSRWVDGAVGELRLVQVLTGFGLLYLAFLVRDVLALRERNLVIMETLLTALRGQVAPQEREAVEILLAALRSPAQNAREAALRQLKRLTGQDLGTDPAAWEHWWAQHRETFRAGGGSPRSP